MSLRRMGAGAALLVAGAFFTSAEAAPATGGVGTKAAIDPSAMVQKTQVIVFSGRRWCYYWDAWNGPGWYWCGYGWRRGYGWGGGPGWHGWRYESRAWHRRHRGWDRGDRRRVDRGERRDWDRGDWRRSERSFDGRRSGRGDGMSRGRSSGGDDRGSISRGGSDGRGGGEARGGGGGGRGGGDGGGRGGRS